jgi:hypothetical protein
MMNEEGRRDATKEHEGTGREEHDEKTRMFSPAFLCVTSVTLWL